MGKGGGLSVGAGYWGEGAIKERIGMDQAARIKEDLWFESGNDDINYLSQIVCLVFSF